MDDQFVSSDSAAGMLRKIIRLLKDSANGLVASMSYPSSTPMIPNFSAELEHADVISSMADTMAPIKSNPNSMSQFSTVTTLTDLEARWEMIWDRANSSSHWYLPPGSTKPMRQRTIHLQSRHLTANDTLIFKDNCWHLRTFSHWEPREILVKDRMCHRLLSEWESQPKVPRAVFLEQFEQKFVGITRAELIVLSDVLERPASEVSLENSSFEYDALTEGVAIKVEGEEVELETSPPTLFE